MALRMPLGHELWQLAQRRPEVRRTRKATLHYQQTPSTPRTEQGGPGRNTGYKTIIKMSEFLNFKEQNDNFKSQIEQLTFPIMMTAS